MNAKPLPKARRRGQSYVCTNAVVCMYGQQVGFCQEGSLQHNYTTIRPCHPIYGLIYPHFVWVSSGLVFRADRVEVVRTRTLLIGVRPVATAWEFVWAQMGISVWWSMQRVHQGLHMGQRCLLKTIPNLYFKGASLETLTRLLRCRLADHHLQDADLCCTYS